MTVDVFRMKRIAIVGATVNPNKYGNIILRDLRRKGFDVVPVTPNYDSVEGVPAKKSVEELPADVELIVFVVPPEVGLKEVQKAYKSGFRRFWFQPGAESQELLAFAKEHPDAEFSFTRCIMVETNR